MKKLFIDYHKRRTQVALVEDGELVEFQVERQDVPSIVGAIYKGKVVNLIKGMKAAFVNIGLERNAFLYCGESTYDNSSIINKTVSESQELKVSPGDEIMCQVVKEEFGNKGARISTNVSIPGRLLVYVPNNDYVGISRKIEEEEDRARLEKWANDAIKNIDGGVIMRTSSRNASEEQLNNELNSLIAQWKQIVAEYPKAPEFAKLYDEGSLIFRMVRDLMDNDLDSIVFNDEEFAEKIRDKIERVSPKPNIVEVYNGTEDFFSYYGLSSQIDKMLKRKVVLKNGAYLIIDRTEALITIDVNT
ncbi:MAG: ribonuclease E/G, partial [Clostridia bacterium]|nr:ribonuclease E/G [Clostridia bacterium]